LQLVLSLGEGLDLRAQARERVAAVSFQGLDLGLGFLQCRPYGLNELRDRRLALHQRALRDRLIASQRFPRQPQKQLAVGAESFSGE